MVTGGAGLIGSYLVRSLLEKGAAVRVVDLADPGSARNLSDCIKEVEFVQGDLRRDGIARSAVKNIDILYHLAARVSGAQYTQSHELAIGLDNMDIDRTVLGAVRKERVPVFLYASSAGVYDRTEAVRIPTPETEAWRGEPDSLYGMVKLVGERMSLLVGKEIGTRVAIARLFPTYGYGEDRSESGRVIPHLIRKILRKEPYVIWGDGSNTRTFLHVTDAVRALTTMAEKIDKVDRVPVNVGSPDATTIRDLAFMIAELSPYSSKSSPTFNMSKSAGSVSMVPDIALIEALTGWTPAVPLKRGLTELFEYYRRVYKLS